ncbi:MAG: hemerythrin domain-containing protein [Deltaproteobacteria bacterium]|nr:hemerythrin domain-containing protein [Deltaproteobacteria bacterium]MBW2420988.1 hemerythrin domain-containing protein [Deltaproteobacteria bacterium]
MSDATPSLSEFFTHDHRRCDSIWAEVEAVADQGASENIAAVWRRFENAQRRHLDMEEQILFPAFEAATGMTEGPTSVMRSEHAQMRGLLDQMDAAVGAGNFEELVDLGDTLLLLIQQHNQKEEHMLYPMSERALTPQWPDLRAELDQFPEQPSA